MLTYPSKLCQHNLPRPTHNCVSWIPPTELPPDPPIGVSVSDEQSKSVLVSWNGQPGVDSYEVQYEQAPEGAQLGLCPIDDGDSGTVTVSGGSSVTVGGLQEFTTYTITVVAVSGVLKSPGSEPVIFTTAQAGRILP